MRVTTEEMITEYDKFSFVTLNELAEVSTEYLDEIRHGFSELTPELQDFLLYYLARKELLSYTD